MSVSDDDFQLVGQSPQSILSEFEAAKKAYWLEYDSGYSYFSSCYDTMKEILTQLRFFQHPKIVRVLNLCGAPGGFSKALLQTNQNIDIDLLTLPELPEGKGGYKMIFKDNRVKVNKVGDQPLDGDVVKFAQNIKESSTPWRYKHDLVILDGQFMGGTTLHRYHQRTRQVQEEEDEEEEEEDDEFEDPSTIEQVLAAVERRRQIAEETAKNVMRLKLSELYIALGCISSCGTLITRMSMGSKRQTDILLPLICSLFVDITVIKPRRFSKMWSSSYCYLVCKGQNNDDSFANIWNKVWLLRTQIDQQKWTELMDEEIDSFPERNRVREQKVKDDFHKKSTKLFQEQLKRIKKEVRDYGTLTDQPEQSGSQPGPSGSKAYRRGGKSGRKT